MRELLRSQSMRNHDGGVMTTSGDVSVSAIDETADIPSTSSSALCRGRVFERLCASWVSTR